MSTMAHGPDRGLAEGRPDVSRVERLTAAAIGLPSWRLTAQQRDHVDLLQTGGYAPLEGFATRRDLGPAAWRSTDPRGPTPRLTLVVDPATAGAATEAGSVALRDQDGTLLALLDVADAWMDGGAWHLGGRLAAVRTPTRWDFLDLRAPLGAIRTELSAGREAVVVAQPTVPVDRRTAASWVRAAADVAGRLVVLPVVGGATGRHDVGLVRSCRSLLSHLPSSTRLWVVPTTGAPSDPDAALLRALVARNIGATHLLTMHAVDRDAAESLGLASVEPGAYGRATDPPPGDYHPEVAVEVLRAHPPRSRQGLVLLLTGFSGSGKSTIAKALLARLMEAGDREVSLLDGDVVRQHLSSGLGFSRTDRDLNVTRIGFVATEIARHGGVAICAPIAPYDAARREVRAMATAAGIGFVLVHVATPLGVCERRDVKGLYRQARRGQLPGFTGIDDPYEEPEDAEIVVDTSERTPNEAAGRILAWLRREGWYPTE
jgi:sulfate adenylyltransferase